MNEESHQTQQEHHQPMSVFSCLAAGFETVARHPELILLPSLLDVFLWLGPHLSFAPFFRAIIHVLQTFGDEFGQEMLFLQKTLTEVSQNLNGFIMLGPAPLSSIPALLWEKLMQYDIVRGWDRNSLGVPSLLAELATSKRPFTVQWDIIVSNSIAVFGWIFGIVIMGALLNAYYLRSIGQRVLEENEYVLPGARSTLNLWGQLLKLTFTLALILFAVLTFTAIIIALVEQVQILAQFTLAFSSALVFFVGLHLIFVIPGIVQLRRDLLRAVHESIILVRSDFLSVMFMILLVFIIARGFGFVWALPEPESWTLMISIAGHAFVSTALTATLFVFYQDRLYFLEILTHVFTRETSAHPITGE